MSGIADVITGRSARMARQAQDRQASDLAAERARVDAVQAGQDKIRQGGGGLLAYIDENLRATFGGKAAGGSSG